ncbi:MAG: hypothetical protein AAF621_03675 [Pseudomonadota bacterium]
MSPSVRRKRPITASENSEVSSKVSGKTPRRQKVAKRAQGNVNHQASETHDTETIRWFKERTEFNGTDFKYLVNQFSELVNSLLNPEVPEALNEHPIFVKEAIKRIREAGITDVSKVIERIKQSATKAKTLFVLFANNKESLEIVNNITKKCNNIAECDLRRGIANLLISQETQNIRPSLYLTSLFTVYYCLTNSVPGSDANTPKNNQILTEELIRRYEQKYESLSPNIHGLTDEEQKEYAGVVAILAHLTNFLIELQKKQSIEDKSLEDKLERFSNLHIDNIAKGWQSHTLPVYPYETRKILDRFDYNFFILSKEIAIQKIKSDQYSPEQKNRLQQVFEIGSVGEKRPRDESSGEERSTRRQRLEEAYSSSASGEPPTQNEPAFAMEAAMVEEEDLPRQKAAEQEALAHQLETLQSKYNKLSEQAAEALLASEVAFAAVTAETTKSTENYRKELVLLEEQNAALADQLAKEKHNRETAEARTTAAEAGATALADQLAKEKHNRETAEARTTAAEASAAALANQLAKEKHNRETAEARTTAAEAKDAANAAMINSVRQKSLILADRICPMNAAFRAKLSEEMCNKNAAEADAAARADELAQERFKREAAEANVAERAAKLAKEQYAREVKAISDELQLRKIGLEVVLGNEQKKSKQLSEMTQKLEGDLKKSDAGAAATAAEAARLAQEYRDELASLNKQNSDLSGRLDTEIRDRELTGSHLAEELERINQATLRLSRHLAKNSGTDELPQAPPNT